MASDAFERELIGLIPQMRAFARSLCGGDVAAADDLAQDGLARALKARASYERDTNMKAWLYMIVRNQFYSDKRRTWRAQQLDPEQAERTLLAVDDPISTLALDEVRRGLNLLNHEQREALILIGACGMSYEEASEIVGVPVGTVKSRVSRARIALHQLLAKAAPAKDTTLPSQAMAAILATADT